MASRKDKSPSPVRAGFVHAFASFVVFGAVTALIGGAVHIAGDQAEAGPRYVVALFEDANEADTPLRAELKSASTRGVRTFSTDDRNVSEAAANIDEPSLGVADPGAGAPQPVARRASAEPGARGIRINGRLVTPGQSYSQIEQGSAGDNATEIVAASLNQSTAAVVKSEYARTFSNPDGKPIVSLIVGGLGTSYRQAISAIDDLPAEVTLSFVPDADSRLLRYARQKGHEILLEVPMESYGYGRTRPHGLTLRAGAPSDQNVGRLTSLLRGKSSLYGLINYQGEKFMATEGATQPILKEAAGRGLAFFQHGSTKRSTLAAEAADLGISFAAAARDIDTETGASFIEDQLFKLETEALENGHALGTGFSYPLTVDLIAAWSVRLQQKGILLAPASAAADAAVKAGNETPTLQTSQLAVDPNAAPKTP